MECKGNVTLCGTGPLETPGGPLQGVFPTAGTLVLLLYLLLLHELLQQLWSNVRGPAEGKTQGSTIGYRCVCVRECACV